jgi:hypothetical protein
MGGQAFVPWANPFAAGSVHRERFTVNGEPALPVSPVCVSKFCGQKEQKIKAKD